MSRSANSPSITVKVGKKHEAFNVPKALLSHHPSCFRGALNGGFKDAQENAVVSPPAMPILRRRILMPQADPRSRDPHVFNIFVFWLYTGTLFSPRDASWQEISVISLQTGVSRMVRTSVNVSQKMLAQVWLFGDRHGIPELQNAAMNAIHQRNYDTWSFFPEVVRLVYDETVAGPSPKFRHYCVEVFANIGPAPDTDPNLLVVVFLCELSKHLFQARKHQTLARYTKEQWNRLDLCRFHLHDKTDCQGNAIEKPAAALT